MASKLIHKLLSLILVCSCSITSAVPVSSLKPGQKFSLATQSSFSSMISLERGDSGFIISEDEKLSQLLDNRFRRDAVRFYLASLEGKSESYGLSYRRLKTMVEEHLDQYAFIDDRGAVSLLDIIGPIARGPSSSHTAGVKKMGAIFRKISKALEDGGARRVEVTFKGSLGAVGKSRGSDKAFIAGFTGGDTVSTDRDESDNIAITTHFISDLAANERPDTVHIKWARPGGRELRITMVSTGGGMVEVESINDIRLQHGSSGYIIFRCDTKEREKIQALVRQRNPVMIKEDDFIILKSGKDGAILKLLRGSGSLDKIMFGFVEPNFWENPSPYNLDTSRDILQFTKERKMTLPDFFMRYQEGMAFYGDDNVSMQKIIEKQIDDVWNIMRKGLPEEVEVSGDEDWSVISRQAFDLAQEIATKSSNGGIVACAPTAGSSGILPGCLLAVGTQQGVSSNEIRKALVVAAGIGMMIQKHASLAGAEVGCQGECGSASAMAAAAIASIRGASNSQIFSAATLALSYQLGLVCDPLNGEVKFPCIIRNSSGAALAMNAVQVILTEGKEYPAGAFDQVVTKMNEIGSLLPQSYKEMGYETDIKGEHVGSFVGKINEGLTMLRENENMPFEVFNKAFIQTLDIADNRVRQSIESGYLAYHLSLQKNASEQVALRTMILAVNSFLGADYDFITAADEAILINAKTSMVLAGRAVRSEISMKDTLKHLLILDLETIKIRKLDVRKEKIDRVESFLNATTETAYTQKNQNTTMLIGIDTSWLPRDDEKGLVQDLLVEFERMSKSEGFADIVIVRGEGESLAQEVKAAAERKNIQRSNIILLGNDKVFESKAFNQFRRSGSFEDWAFFAGIVLPDSLEKLPPNSYVRIFELISKAMLLWSNNENVEMITNKLKIVPDGRNYFKFNIPKAEILPSKLLREIYEAQLSALRKA